VAAPLILPRSKRSLLVVLLASLAAVVVGLAPAGHAYAQPSVQQIEAQIDDLWNKLEPLIEQYNGVHYQLQQNLQKQDQLNKTLAPLQMTVDLAQSRVGAMSAQLYEGGPGSNVAALLSAGSPSAFLDQLTTLDQLARHQHNEISVTQSQLDEYNKQKAPLDALVAQQQQQDADLAAKKKDIQGQLDQLQQLRQQAYGSSGSAPGGNLKPVACPFTFIGGAAGKAIAYACSKIGSQYVWATAGPNTFDCSGLTEAAWASAGYSLAHYTVTQKQQTKRISAADLRPGDLVFYGSDVHHVAIYAGGGWVVHAPNPAKKVQMAKMAAIGSINSYGRVA
jgi:cell wall-associated NlpC family hydrolase